MPPPAQGLTITHKASVQEEAPLSGQSAFQSAEGLDRGRESRLGSAPPPSEPDGRVSRIRLSSRWFYRRADWQTDTWAAASESSLRSVK